MAEEGLLQPASGAAADPGQESGGDIDRCQLLQQVAGPTDRQMMRTGQQRGTAIVSGPIRTGQPGAATVAAWQTGTASSSQPGVVTAPQQAQTVETR